MWLLCDAVLPQSLADEARSLDIQRWDGANVTDEELVRAVSGQGGRGVLFLGRDSLEQPDLRRLAKELGVALIAVATDDPIEAKRPIIKNQTAIRTQRGTQGHQRQHTPPLGCIHRTGSRSSNRSEQARP